MTQGWPVRASHSSDHSERFQGGHMAQSEPRRGILGPSRKRELALPEILRA